MHTVADLEGVSEDELVRVVGQAHGTSLYRMARADDDRPVVAEREAKSISVEGTYDTDLVDRRLLEGLVDRQAGQVAERLRDGAAVGSHGDGQDPAARLHHPHPLDAPCRRRPTTPGWSPGWPGALLGEVDTSGGVRLLGVGVSGLADWIQEDLFAEYDDEAAVRPEPAAEEAVAAITRAPAAGHPGMDVVHDEHGPGWVWGSGLGRVTVRFETAETPPGAGAHLPGRRPGPGDDPSARPPRRGRRARRREDPAVSDA